LQKNITDDTVESVQTLSENTKIGLIAKFISWINGESDDVTKSVDVTETVTAESVSSNTQTTPNVNIYIGRNAEVEKAVESEEIAKAMECPDCGASVAESADTCPECGAEMDMAEGNMKKTGAEISMISIEIGEDGEEEGTACPECGAMAESGDAYCKACGTQMPASEVEKSVESDETITDGEDNGGNEVDLEKLMEGIGTLLDEKISKIKEEVIETVDEKLAEITKSVDEKVETVSERVETVENAGAIKKSVDQEVVGDEEIIEKKAESFWGGIFVPAEIAEVLGYES